MLTHVRPCTRHTALIWNQRHLMTVLREYEDFYNTHRPHRPINQAAPLRPLLVRSAIQAPRMNSIMERWIGSCRRELLDRRWRHRPGPLPRPAARPRRRRDSRISPGGIGFRHPHGAITPPPAEALHLHGLDYCKTEADIHGTRPSPGPRGGAHATVQGGDVVPKVGSGPTHQGNALQHVRSSYRAEIADVVLRHAEGSEMILRELCQLVALHIEFGDRP
jgi:hypothetical protein